MEAWHSLILGGSAALFVGFGAFERRRHETLLERFLPRIVVTGTRGKSSVTRLIRAGLGATREGVFGKTTGTLPRLIFPDGSEEPIVRRGKPNVLEQLEVVARAFELGGKALVVECMALHPENHFLFVDSLVKPTHTVVTNVRPDHLEVMGPTTRSVAETLASVTPIGGKLFVPRGSFEDVFARAAKDRKSEFERVVTDGVVSAEELSKFSYLEHAENVALALAVTTSLGIPRKLALSAMQGMNPDPGALMTAMTKGPGAYRFVSAFAANDPESTLRLYRECLERYAPRHTRAVLMNCRADRIERSLQLASALGHERSIDLFVLLGEGTDAFENELRREDRYGRMVVTIPGDNPRDVAFRLDELVAEGGIAVGVGNIGGIGLGLSEYFLEKNLRDPSKGIAS